MNFKREIDETWSKKHVNITVGIQELTAVAFQAKIMKRDGKKGETRSKQEERGKSHPSEKGG